MKKESHLILQEISNRNIDSLIHFTPTINLLGMYECGAIIPRGRLTKLPEYNIEMEDYVEFSDNFRYDGKDFINTSIQHPNSPLFFRFIEDKKEKAWIKWCIIKISPKYICNNDTLFSVTNAANSYNRKQIGIDGSYEKFKQMFASELIIQSSCYTKRLNRINLPMNYTTDEQAEVLVKDDILVKDFISVVFQNEVDMALTKAAIPNHSCSNFIVDSSLFPRNYRCE